MMKTSSSYSLRGFEPGNLSDIERMNLMYYHPEVMKAKGYFKQDSDFSLNVDLQEVNDSMFNILSTISDKFEDVSYAVVDSVNKLVGWIWFYVDKRHGLPVKIVKRLGLTTENSRIYQVSYEKLMSGGWPEDLLSKTVHVDHVELHAPRKGVIVEGLRLAIEKLSTEYQRLYSPEHKLVLYGYVLADNIASAKVLERNGFEVETKKYRYDGLLHDLWVKII